jgi:hypothetical protein
MGDPVKVETAAEDLAKLLRCKMCLIVLNRPAYRPRRVYSAHQNVKSRGWATYR